MIITFPSTVRHHFGFARPSECFTVSSLIFLICTFAPTNKNLRKIESALLGISMPDINTFSLCSGSEKPKKGGGSSKEEEEGETEESKWTEEKSKEKGV